MMMHEPLRFEVLRGALHLDEPMSRHTSWRCGGVADRAYAPADADDLATFVRQLAPSEPVLPVGLGSNLLVRDGGVRGTVLLLHAALGELRVGDDGLIHAGAGVAAPKLARFAANAQRRGAEFMAGIPGTVGGALAMNAGCYGGETWHFVAAVDVLTREGRVEQRTPADYEIGYRCATAKRTPAEAVFLAARFRFPPGDGAAARGQIKELLARRIATQPLSLPNAGSVFRNPKTDHAARLIEACGLKGFSIGGASVSPKHANFIVNAEGSASAQDIERLIEHVQHAVEAATGVRLEPEVKIVGEAAA